MSGRRIADLRQELADGHAALRGAPTVAISREVAPEQPAPGSIGQLVARLQQRGEADLRVEARKATDTVWLRAEEDVRARFGRGLPLKLVDQPNAAAEMALIAARVDEQHYLRLWIAGASAEAAATAYDGFCTAVAKFLNAVSVGWPPAAVHLEQERKRREEG